MKVEIKDFAVDLQVKSKGLEFEVRKPDGTFLGDLVVTNTQVIWCLGKTDRKNGVSVKLQDLMQILASPATKKAAISAAKKA